MPHWRRPALPHPCHTPPDRLDTPPPTPAAPTTPATGNHTRPAQNLPPPPPLNSLIYARHPTRDGAPVAARWRSLKKSSTLARVPHGTAPDGARG